MIGRRTLAALLAPSLIASSALAQPKGPTEKDKQAAGELVKKAIAKSTAGEHSAAIEIYLQAYTIVPNSILLSNIGTEFQKIGKHVEALRYFCLYLAQEPNGTNVPYATSRAKAMQIKLGNDVDDGDVCAPQRKEPRRKEPDPDPPEPPEKPRRPREPLQDPVRAPEPETDPLRYGAVVSGVAGLAAIGLGAYAGVRARAISDEISSHDRNQPWPQDIRDLERRGQLFENIQIGGLIAGGVLVTTATILYVSSRSRSREPSSDSVVTVAPTSNGVVVYGRF
jgi:hypothetical protein